LRDIIPPYDNFYERDDLYDDVYNIIDENELEEDRDEISNENFLSSDDAGKKVIKDILADEDEGGDVGGDDYYNTHFVNKADDQQLKYEIGDKKKQMINLKKELIIIEQNEKRRLEVQNGEDLMFMSKTENEEDVINNVVDPKLLIVPTNAPDPVRPANVDVVVKNLNLNSSLSSELTINTVQLTVTPPSSPNPFKFASASSSDSIFLPLERTIPESLPPLDENIRIDILNTSISTDLSFSDISLSLPAFSFYLSRFQKDFNVFLLILKYKKSKVSCILNNINMYIL
jgi:hypothetical protein